MSKKVISLLLAVVLVFSLGATALAADVQYPVIKGEYTHCPSLGFLDFVGNVSLSFEYSDAYFAHTGYQYDHKLANASMVLTQASFASATSSTEVTPQSTVTISPAQPEISRTAFSFRP